jgi:GAF domain-containing protein
MNDGRAARYERIAAQLRELIEVRSPSLVAAMATICAVLHAKMPHHSWTGFYFVAADDELHVGPYQGSVACQILRGQGACLHAVQTRTSVIVPDVHAFPGHIPCDPRSRSEIVIPIVKGDRVVAVLDVDSSEFAQFSDEDAASLERIVALLHPFC